MYPVLRDGLYVPYLIGLHRWDSRGRPIKRRSRHFYAASSVIILVASQPKVVFLFGLLLYAVMKPPIKKRSKLRLLLGTAYFTARRQLYWHFSGTRFAKRRQVESLPVEVFAHQSLLLRQLKDVDMKLQYNKITNLRLAIAKIDGLVIKPGETFSYWRLIGKPTKRQGYLDGMVLHDGTFSPGIGGGLCQLSNLIFWMTLHTPLTVIERWRHSYDVFPDAQRTLPFGSGATCSYPNIDLQIRNDSGHPFQLRLGLTDTHLVGRWLSESEIPNVYEVVEKNHAIEHQSWGGYMRHNELWKNTHDRQTGSTLATECVCVNNAIMMYKPFLE